MKKILIGMVYDGTAGGVDKYILNFFDSINDQHLQIDFLTNLAENSFLQKIDSPSSSLICVSGLSHPFRQYRQIKKVLQNGYDVLYLNVSTALTVPAFLAAKHSGVKKIIVHSHSSGYDCPSPLKRCLMTILHHLCKHILCRCATDFLSCSDKASEWMFTNRILRKQQVKIIRNTANLTQFYYDEAIRNTIRKQLGAENRYIIGYVGNLVYQKNPLLLANILKEVVKLDPSALLVVIGDGPYRTALENKITAYGLNDHLCMLGKVDASKGYMSAFDVFVLPSRFEGMPIVSVEAQCSKLPCVFSDTITSMAKISNMCDFVPSKEPKAFAQALLKYKNIPRDSQKIVVDLQDFSLHAQKATLRSVIE